MLTTELLKLRPFTAGDAGDFLGLASHWDVARMTSDIPHPLTLHDARQWLLPAPDEARFALMENDVLIGGAGYFLQPGGAVELGFWLGRAYWGRGLATEAVKAVVGYGLQLDCTPAFTSSHFTDNPASGRVLVKLGFLAVGTARIRSIARGADVAAICYWLSREQAAARLGLQVPALTAEPGRAEPASRARRLTSLFGRLTGSA